jgi:uroporphyrinogen decarboxylase
MLDVLHNRRPACLPIYEHIISPKIMERILQVPFADLQTGTGSDLKEFFTHYCRFFQEMTYDTISFEVCITEILPGHGAIMGGRPGPIQNREDFEQYPWDELSRRFWDVADQQFAMLGQCLPEGMKALGGVGNGVLEISEDLVGFQYLCYLMADDPDLVTNLYRRIGDLMVEIWTTFLQRYADYFVICRFGDDLGFRSGPLVSPKVIKTHIIPQYRRVVELIQKANRPFLWHSCGNIFSIMEEVIAIGINAKHSNEDAIAPFDKWIELYNDRIGLLGGIDVDLLCCEPPEAIVKQVVDKGQRFRTQAKGYALGSGNSIPDYVPVEGYLAMIQAAQQIRHNE